jgi:hypothetical protein
MRARRGLLLAGLIGALALGAALCAHRALQAGLNPFAWFAAGLSLNVLAYLALLMRPPLVQISGTHS